MSDPKAEARARVEAAKLAITAQREVEAEQAEVQRLEREALGLEALAKAEREHGSSRVMALETDQGIVIVKAPNHVAYRKWQDTTERVSTEALEQLVFPCIVYPSISEFERILERLPHTLQRCSDAVTVLAGYRKDDLAKK